MSDDILEHAQDVTAPVVIAGNAAETHPGFPLPGTDESEVQDLYLLQATTPVQMILTIAADDPLTNDLDLVLMDSTGHVIEVSEGALTTERLDTSESGLFWVGVRAFRGSSAYALSIVDANSPPGTSANLVPFGADFVPGDIFVKLRPSSPDASRAIARTAARYGATSRSSVPDGATLMRLMQTSDDSQSGKLRPQLGLPVIPDQALKTQTLDTLRAMRADPQIDYADLNFLRPPAAAPQDELFDQQWYYQVLNLPPAWEVTTGSESVIVAVIDTGVLVNHPDIESRLMPGYDFISDASRANDGNGLDANPNDAGDGPDGTSGSFHGTLVAGLIGAATDNRVGIAGVTWQTRLMPLRVSGVDGATDEDLIQALYYAVGLTNNSGSVPSEPARIINISLAGPGFSQTLHDAIQAVLAQGAVVVAAAGNKNTRTRFYPAATAGVLSVTAVDLDRQKAWYANFGYSVDVAAPGGDLRADLDANGTADGVLSTSGDRKGNFVYRYNSGTSMAAPQVAGILALMVAANPHLTRLDIERLLAGTHPVTTIRITQDLGEPGYDERFGYGLFDAYSAVYAAVSIPGGTITVIPEPILHVSTPELYFDRVASILPIDITNAGSGILSVTRIVTDAAWLKIAPAAGTAPLTVQAMVDRTGLAPGTYAGTIEIIADTNAGQQTATIQVDMQTDDNPSGDIGSAVVLVLDAETLDVVAQVETDATRQYAFRTPGLAPGAYLIVAGTDRNRDGVMCEAADTCGVYPDTMTISAGRLTPDIDLVVEHPVPSQLPRPAVMMRHIVAQK